MNLNEISEVHSQNNDSQNQMLSLFLFVQKWITSYNWYVLKAYA